MEKYSQKFFKNSFRVMRHDAYTEIVITSDYQVFVESKHMQDMENESTFQKTKLLFETLIEEMQTVVLIKNENEFYD